MPPKKKICLGRNTLNARKAKMSRVAESPNNRKKRLAINRSRNRESRAAEITNVREIRLEVNRLRNRESRAAETLGQRDVRLQNIRERASTSRRAIWADLKLEAFNYNKAFDYRFVVFVLLNVYN